MTYEDFEKMLDGHTFVFGFNDYGEAVTITSNPSGWIKVQTSKKNGDFKTEIYYTNGEKEEY